MKRPAHRFRIALALAVVAACASVPAPSSTAARQDARPLVARELWAVHVDRRSAPRLTYASLARARAAGVNTVVLRGAGEQLVRTRRRAAAAGLLLPGVQPRPTCGALPASATCVVHAGSVRDALKLARQRGVDLVVVRIAGPGALSSLASTARGHILAVAGLGGRARFDPRLWRSAIRAAHGSKAVDLGVSLGLRTGSQAFTAYVAVLTETLHVGRPAPAPPPAGSTPSPRGPGGSALPGRLAVSAGQTFYVAPNGSDGAAGTQGAPWRTIQRALDRLKPGQRALVRAGTYREDLELDRAGTASAPITVEAYPGERPVLTSAGGHPLEVGEDGAYFRFRGFVIEKHPGTSGGNVDVYGHHVEISGNEIRNGRDQGIYTAEESHHVQILDNWIHDNGEGISHQSHGVYLQGDDHLVANNRISDHPEGFGIQVYDSGSGSIITSNTVTGAGHSGIVIGGDGGVDDITVVNNVFAFNAHYGISHDSTCPTASRAHHNVVHGNGWGALQGGCSGLDFTGGNRTANPLFADYRTRDLHLQPGSPALDYALADFSPAVDHDGRGRPQGPAPDAGAFER